MLGRTALLLVVMSLGGCDLLFQLQHVDPADGAVSGCDGTNVVHTSFSDDLEFARYWDRNPETSTGATIAIANGALALTVGVPSGYARAEGNVMYDIRGGTLQVQLVAPFDAANSEQFIALELPALDTPRCYIGVDGGDSIDVTLACKTDLGDVPTPRYLPFDPIAHRWLRMQQVGTGMQFFTSADGETWTQRHQVDAPTFDFSQAKLVLGAGSYDPGVDQPYTARFDDFDFCVP